MRAFLPKSVFVCLFVGLLDRWIFTGGLSALKGASHLISSHLAEGFRRTQRCRQTLGTDIDNVERRNWQRLILLSAKLCEIELDSPSSVVYLLFAPQCTIGTSCGMTRSARSAAEGVAGPVGALIRTVGSPSPSNVASAAGPATTKGHRVELQRACAPWCQLCRLGCHEEHTSTANHVELLTVLSGYPTLVLREVHIATRLHHGPQRPYRPPHVQHAVVRRDFADFCLIARLAHAVLLHLCA